jgi:UDP-N-acetylmuramate dehydrogenase
MTVLQRRSLKTLNTFGIEATAKYFSEIRSKEEFQALSRDGRFAGQKKLVLGGGSNILFTEDFDGWVVKNSIPGIEIVKETPGEAIVKAGAGEDWHGFVNWCIEKNYGGLENLSLIPGLVGAAPVQNIGAYGVELKDTFHELEAVEIDSGVSVTFKASDCGFGYRESVFKSKFRGKFFITSVSFKLAKVTSPGASYRFQTEYGDVRKVLEEMKPAELSLKTVSEAICRIRRAKLPDPKELGNAGSFFKNPSISQSQYELLINRYPGMPHYPQQDGTVKIPGGWLIEQCGWKGKAMGRVGCHKDQALVLVNRGGAKGREILEFAEAIRISVREKFGIELSFEVNIV